MENLCFCSHLRLTRGRAPLNPGGGVEGVGGCGGMCVWGWTESNG